MNSEYTSFHGEKFPDPLKFYLDVHASKIWIYCCFKAVLRVVHTKSLGNDAQLSLKCANNYKHGRYGVVFMPRLPKMHSGVK